MRRHPERHELYALAECAVRGRSAIPARLASHVTKCQACRIEVNGIRATLKIAQTAGTVEPSDAFAAQLQMRVRKEARSRMKRQALGQAWQRGGKGLVYAAALAVFAVAAFSGASVMEEAPAAPDELAWSAGPAAARGFVATPREDGLQETAEQVRLLSQAVQARVLNPGGAWERQYQRAVGILDADIEEAFMALQRNPGYSRASDLANANLQRQAQTLKSLYMGTSL